MGTSIRVELWESEPGTGEDLIALVMDEMRRIDRRMSTYRADSLLSQVNREASAAPVQLDDELYDVQPDDVARENALQAVGYGNVRLNQRTRTIRFDREGVNINLGGVAKGYAVENGVKILRRRGVTSAIVTAGGDSRILGDRRGRPWTVGIRDPRDRTGLVTRIPLQDEAISTSGDYERFFESEGERVHHIIKPDTGKSASAVRSVTIIGGDATVTDALSTGVFVLGRERGLALIETLADFEAVVIDQHGKMHYSSGLTPGG